MSGARALASNVIKNAHSARGTMAANESNGKYLYDCRAEQNRLKERRREMKQQRQQQAREPLLVTFSLSLSLSLSLFHCSSAQAKVNQEAPEC